MPLYAGRIHRVIDVTPTISTSLYATGDLVGGKLSFTGAGIAGAASSAGVVRSVAITDLSAQGADFDLLLFDADPSGTTFTDNAALDVADADLVKLVGTAQITTHLSFNDNGLSIAHDLYIPFDLGTGTTLYGALVVRAGPTYAGTTDLTVRLGVLQD